MNKSDWRSPIISSLDEMESVRNEWTEIYEGNDVKPHYLSFDYVRLWYNCFATPDQIRIYRIVDNDITIGFLPLVGESKFSLKILKSLTNFHCMHSGPLVRNGYEMQFTERAYGVLHSSESSWDLLHYNYVYSFSKNTFPLDYDSDIFVNKFQKSISPNYVISLGNSFNDYFINLDQKFRRNYNLSKNRSTRAGVNTFKHYTGLEAKRQWPELVRLEDMGWKGEKSTSLKRIGLNYQKYYDGLLELLAERGTLSLFFWLLDDKPIAGGIGYIEDNVFHWWKAGFDPAYQAISPSNLLLFSIIDFLTVHCPNVKKINMFTGDFGYKHRYSNEEAYCSEITIYSRTVMGVGAYYFEEIKRRAKRHTIINKIIELSRKYGGNE